ncbi:response regulator [Rhizobium rhizogenes]|uniref:Response regulator n=1 Tax=Rhizobium rhizogenes TaxID=359 RepID=A0AA92C4F6_RHIRH|nr:response regulator [Rhizobium rhizogenes]PVE55356.1 response regulator [Rhizobium rhizogenes]PVE65722.1 response regulator [Agrobacterium tumefaciens]PVE75786.1 response regulator [Sphingomonas sp. TPD3009]
MSEEHTPFALVVDDDALIRMDAANILEEAGFRVLEAATPEEALSVLEQRGDSVQLLFTDVQMPPSELDGFYLAKECAASWPEIGIIVASGQIEPKAEDLPDGAIFVRKPFSADVVHDHLQRLLPDGKKPEPLKQRASSLG